MYDSDSLTRLVVNLVIINNSINMVINIHLSGHYIAIYLTLVEISDVFFISILGLIYDIMISDYWILNKLRTYDIDNYTNDGFIMNIHVKLGHMYSSSFIRILSIINEISFRIYDNSFPFNKI